MLPCTNRWYDFDNGATIGQQGSESGVIVLDEEYEQATRISLERSTSVAPFAITCGVYGRLMHTRYFGEEAEARVEYDVMKMALKQIVDGFDSENEQLRQHAMQMIDEFVDRFPT